MYNNFIYNIFRKNSDLKKKSIILLSILVLFFITSCGKKKGGENEYEVTTVSKGDITLSVSKTGQIASDNVVSVYTTASQRVQKVLFEEGDNVKKGDVVVTFYPVDKDETLRNIQKKKLEIQKYSRDVRNAEELVKVGGESKVNLQNARILLETAQLELATLQDDLALIKSEIVSPVDGVITSMTADEDYKVNTETTLFKVSDTGNIKAEVALSDLQMRNIKVGQRVEITSDVLGNEKIEGYVSEISGVASKSSSLDESNTTVTIKFDDAKGLRPGTTINAIIYYEEAKDIIKVPYTSIINEDGKYYAYVVDNDSKVAKKEVKIGINDSSFYQISEGISEGDRIITIVDESLKDGSKIKVIDEETARKNREKSAKSNGKSNSNNNRGGGRGPRGPM